MMYRKSGNGKKIFNYIFFYFFVLFLLLNLVKKQLPFYPIPQTALEANNGYFWTKVEFFKKRIEAGDYNVLYLGDSRSYCNIQNDMVEKKLFPGVSSLNLSHFGVWFPIQYRLFKELIPIIRNQKNITVVWTINPDNFRRIDYGTQKENQWWVASMYSIDLETVYEFWKMGYPLRRLIDEYILSPNSFFPKLWQKTNEWRQKLEEPIYLPFILTDYKPKQGSTIASQPVYSKRTDKTIQYGHTEKVNQIIRFYEEQPGTLIIKPVENEKKEITSIEIVRSGGSYYRIEITPEFFREKQSASRTRISNVYSARPVVKCVEIAPPHFNLFLKILKLCKDNNINLIINEFHKAPFNYVSNEHKNVCYSFMSDIVKKETEKNGFSYIAVDYDIFEDSDFFDADHMNSKGGDKLAPMLAEKLYPLLLDLKSS